VVPGSRAAGAAGGGPATGAGVGTVGTGTTGGTGADASPGERPGSAASSWAGPDAGGGAGPDPEEAARQICLRQLATGPRTRAQLATALRRRRVPEEVAEAVLGRFAEVRLIDDAAFARAWVESRHHGRGLARRALSAELRERGVAAEEVRTAVGSLGDQDEIATARRLVAKRAAASRGRPLPARMRQLVGMLARKGYPAGLAYQVVREALEREGQPGLEAICDPDTGADTDDVFGPDIAADATVADEWTAR
jgi:regulatory protein